MDLEHGDTLVCYGRSPASWVIRVWTGLKRPWRWWRNGRRVPSHVAFVVMADSTRLVFESTTLSKLADAVSGTFRQGVQAHLPVDWLANYDGRVELWRLKVRPLESSRKASAAYARERHESQTDYDEKQAIGAGLDVVRNTQNGDRLFCSEFWAFFGQRGGWIGSWVNASEVTPLDVVGFPCHEFYRRLK